MNMFLGELHTIAGEIKTFNLFDLFTIGTLAGLEGILSIDNALVLAILVKNLPRKQQKRALVYGIWGAFIFRFIAIIFATFIVKMPIFRLVGGGYLIYISMGHMFSVGYENREEGKKSYNSFWGAVIAVELTDIACSIDSIAAAVGISEKVIILWLGGVFGIIAMRLLSGAFVKLLEKFPKAEDLAYQLVFFVGIRLAMDAFGKGFSRGTFWLVMAVILIIGCSLIYRDYYLSKQSEKMTEKLIQGIKAGDVNFEEIIEKQETINTDLIRYLLRKKRLVITSKKNLQMLKKFLYEEDEIAEKAESKITAQL